MQIKRIGIICLAGRGHLYPATALGRKLRDHGFEVTIFNRNVARSLVQAASLRFGLIQDVCSDHVDVFPPQSCRGPGPNTLNIMFNHALLVLQYARQVFTQARIEALLVDQMDLASGTVADILGIPFLNLCFSPPLYFDDESPPLFLTGNRALDSQRSDAMRREMHCSVD